MDYISRFTRYTSGQEPVLSTSVVAAILLAIAVKVTEANGLVWEPTSLSIAGAVALIAAGFVARLVAWSPASVQKVADQAASTGSPVITLTPP